MKLLPFLGIGFLFGVVMIKSGAASWFRIYEMFRFESFHMYGIIGTAVVLGVLLVQAIKRLKLRDVTGAPIELPSHQPIKPGHFLGGAIFGLGWGLAGACPGPIFTLIGAGYLPILVLLAGALVGTWLFGVTLGKQQVSIGDKC